MAQSVRAKENGLANNLLFSTLSDSEIDGIRGKVALRKFSRNDIILREEQTNEFMYIILDGEVKVTQASESGREIIVTIHKSGDSFGELSLIDGKTAPAAVYAMKESTIAIISKKDFFELISSHRKVLDNLLQILCGRIRESIKKVQMLNFNNAAQRIKLLLVILSESHGEKTPKGTVLKIKLIHQEIAEMAGLSRETVTRVLDRWQEGGEIEILKNKHIVLRQGFERLQ